MVIVFGIVLILGQDAFKGGKGGNGGNGGTGGDGAVAGLGGQGGNIGRKTSSDYPEWDINGAIPGEDGDNGNVYQTNE